MCLIQALRAAILVGGKAKAFQVAFTFDKPMVAKQVNRFSEAPGKRFKIGNAFIHFHP